MWAVVDRSGHVPEGPVPSGQWHTLDIRACQAWLLWAHRMASPLGGLTGKDLTAFAAAKGLHLTPYGITRAESGNGSLDASVVADYEQLLDLPAGFLLAPLRAAARMVPVGPGTAALLRSRTVADTGADRQLVVDDFYERERDGAPLNGYDWLRLADALTAAPEVLPPRALLADWVRRLMDECMRSVGTAYPPRLEALSTLAADDRCAALVLDAARELTAVPGASGAEEAWGVVGDIRLPEVISTLVAGLPDVPDRGFEAYSIALVMPAHVGALTAGQQEDIGKELQRRLQVWSLGSYEPLAKLAAELPAHLARPVLDAIDRVHPMSRLTGMRPGRDVEDEVARYTDAAMDVSWPGHTGGVLTELLRIVLQNESSALRFHATTLIRWSPFSAVLCDTAVQVCLSHPEPSARQVAAYLAGSLATQQNGPALWRLLREAHSTNAVGSALVGLAHSGNLRPGDDLGPYLRNPRYRNVAVYAAGITAHPGIADSAADSDEAAWWRAEGGGVWT